MKQGYNFAGEAISKISTKRLTKIKGQLQNKMEWTLPLSREWKQAKRDSDAIQAELDLRQ